MMLLLAARSRTATAFLPSLRIVGSRRQLPSSTMFRVTPTTALRASADYSTMTVVELKGLLRKKGCMVSGRKSDLIKRLSSMALEQELQQTSSSKKQAPSSNKQATPPKQRQERSSKHQEATAAPWARIKKSKPKDAPLKQEKPRPKPVVSRASDDDDSFRVAQQAREMRKNIVGVKSDADVNGFSEINVPPPLVTRLREMGLIDPTPIQKEAIPLAMKGRDVMGLAQTGTGKTLAFGVPLVAQMLESKARPRPRAVHGLVLAPTRELANQIAVQLRTLTENTAINTFVVVGGQNINTQINKLKGGTDLLVATPGRLIDLMERRSLSLADTTFLVLDEADQMLDMGFLPSLRKVVKMLPKQRQTMLFSATMSKNMNEVAGSYLKNPVRVEVARAGKTADKITQELHYVAKPDKVDKLVDLLSNHQRERSIVFGRTKHGMEKLSKKLINAGFKAGSIHGNKSQSQRDRAIAAFKSGDIKILVATDVAARGLDIPDVKHVYNYELPNVPEAYVHRIGRTARAGKEGAAIAFCSMEEMDDLLAIQKVTGHKIPVKSGSVWSRTESNQAKTTIKNKLNDQRAARKASKSKPSKNGKPKRYR